MRTRPSAAAVTAAALLLAGAASAGAAGVPPGWVGTMVDGPLIEGQVNPATQFDDMRRAGVGTVRIAFYWDDAQPYRTFADVPGEGGGDVQCARNATVKPDGSLAGEDLLDDLGPEAYIKNFHATGRWTCVGRAFATTTAPEGVFHYTRWSAPVSFFADAAFQFTPIIADASFPTYALAYRDMLPGSTGGKVTLTIKRGKGCPKVATKRFSKRVPASGRVRFNFRLPERHRAKGFFDEGFNEYGWTVIFAFKGTKEIRPYRFSAAGVVVPPPWSVNETHLLGFEPPDTRRGRCARAE